MGEDDRALGRIEGVLEGLRSAVERGDETARFHRQELRAQVGQIERDLSELKGKMEPLAASAKATADKLDAHDERLDAHDAFRDRVGAVVVVASGALTLVMGGIGWIVSMWWDAIIGWIARLVSR